MKFLEGANIVSPVGPLLATFIIGITTLVLLVCYSIRKQQYWKKLGVPYVPPIPFFGSMIESLTKLMQDVEMKRYEKYGRIYGHYEANRPVLSIGDSDLLRDIMVKDFFSFTGRRAFVTDGDKILENVVSLMKGEDWKRVRTIITPTFTTGKIKKMLSIFKDCSSTLAKNFKETAVKGEPVEVKTIYGAFAMDIIASSAFSAKIDSHHSPNNMFVQSARSLLQSFNWRMILFILTPGLTKFFKMKILSQTGVKFFKDVTIQIIEERKRTGQTRNDFLQLLIDTMKEVAEEDAKSDLADNENDIAENYGKDENDQVFKNVYKKSLSFDEVLAQCIVFFLAGFDTTASALSFATYLLTVNPDIQEKLIKELDDSLKENNGELTYEAVQGMKYLDNVISETLRIFPPAIRNERVADEDYKLADTGIVIPKGMLVTIPMYAMHRDPKHFPDPEKFDPDRFTPEERTKRHQYAYMPFGAGPRNCVGMRFALMEIKVCLIHVLSNFRIKKCSKTLVPLEFNNCQGHLNPKDIIVLFEIRKDTVKAL